MLRHITLREFAALVAAELRMRPEEFCDQAFLRISKLSLDRPAARRQTATGQRGRPLHSSLADQLVALVGSLLQHPPIPDYPGRVALAAGEELLRRGHGRWGQRRADTTLRFDQWARSGTFDAGWVRASVGGVRRQAIRRTLPLFDEPAPAIGIFLGGPLNDLRAAGQTSRVGELHRRMDGALRQLEQDLEGALSFRLFHPSHDVENRDAQDLWEWDLGLLEEEVAVLIVAEIGEHAIGFGGACELGHFRRLPGEAVHLLSRQCDSRSNYLQGYSREIGVETLPFSDWQQIPKRVTDFLNSRRLHILDAVRRRDDAVMLVEEDHRAIVTQWSLLSRARQAQLLDDADVSEPCMMRVLQRPSAFAALSAFSQQRMTDSLLGIERGANGSDGEPSIDVDSLLRMAVARSLPAHEIAAVLHHARERTASVAAAATRISYDVKSWSELRDELFGV